MTIYMKNFTGPMLVTVLLPWLPHAFPANCFINSLCVHVLFERSTERVYHNLFGPSSDGWRVDWKKLPGYWRLKDKKTPLTIKIYLLKNNELTAFAAEHNIDIICVQKHRYYSSELEQKYNDTGKRWAVRKKHPQCRYRRCKNASQSLCLKITKQHWENPTKKDVCFM